jgi:hypothetical protein
MAYQGYLTNQGKSTTTPNPSINTDWRDKAASAGYVKRYAPEKMRSAL